MRRLADLSAKVGVQCIFGDGFENGDVRPKVGLDHEQNLAEDDASLISP